jgi:16S rRNA A1518/A1519 N6-dimethyltransferase RsmA/KsgA/DIM1 with predicted DNA glycosylase/AP lyase activity
VMVAAIADQLDKPAVDEVLASFGFPTDTRAEQLDVNELIRLADAVRQRLQPPGGDE